MTTAKIRNRLIQAALTTAESLRHTADRLQRAAERKDYDALALIAVDQIQGVALVLARITSGH